ncbi:MAG TPA: alpha/beta fold hydrolase, partial [Actinomycetota bacterium]|nr:alpha/beta fold hydrolase [Actinomycetota bacterium]
MAVERFLDLRDIRLRLVDFGGRGLPVLILHGLAGRASEWSEVAADLSRRHRVVALDLRGHGGSDKPDDLARRSFAADAMGVLESLDLGAVCLVGQSFGGDIALMVAATRPDLLSALVVIEAVPNLDSETRTLIAAWFRSWP